MFSFYPQFIATIVFLPILLPVVCYYEKIKVLQFTSMQIKVVLGQ